MKRNVARILIVLALAVAGTSIWIFTRPVAAPPPMPNPNGHDDFLKGGQMVVAGGRAYFYREMTTDELRAWVNTNAEAIDLARVGFERESRVPLAHLASSNGATLINDLSIMKSLALVFAAAGRLAELDGHTNAAAGFHMDTVRLGHEAFRGGAMINSLAGLAIQRIGLGYLEKLTNSLDARQCRDIVTTLERVEERRESVESVQESEKQWSRQAYGLKGSFVHLLYFRQNRQSEAKWIASVHAQQVRADRLMIALAARAYELEKGTRPTNVSELIPEYLKAIPKDPATGKDLKYGP